jgi:hypothetical protein
MTDYTSATCNISCGSQLSGDDAEKIVGQSVVHVQAYEYGLKLTFANGSTLEFNGSTYGDCALGVEFSAPAPTVQAG